MNRLSGYHIGLFVNEMDAAAGNIVAQARAAEKFLEHARVLEQEVFEQLQKDGEFNGKTA